MSTESVALERAPYSAGVLFEDQAGTNHEEFIATAPVACFSMALANKLEISKLGATLIETKAFVGSSSK